MPWTFLTVGRGGGAPLEVRTVLPSGSRALMWLLLLLLLHGRRWTKAVHHGHDAMEGRRGVCDGLMEEIEICERHPGKKSMEDGGRSCGVPALCDLNRRGMLSIVHLIKCDSADSSH